MAVIAATVGIVAAAGVATAVAVTAAMGAITGAEAAGEAFGAYAAATYPFSLTPGRVPLVNSTPARARRFVSGEVVI